LGKSRKLPRSQALNDSHHARGWDHYPPSQGVVLLIGKEFAVDKLLKCRAVLGVIVENTLMSISYAVFLAFNPRQLQ
jgi:hypothetical protein